jgi:heme/copper-type cytochrome/quinol oxidase subunit 4
VQELFAAIVPQAEAAAAAEAVVAAQMAAEVEQLAEAEVAKVTARRDAKAAACCRRLRTAGLLCLLAFVAIVTVTTARSLFGQVAASSEPGAVMILGALVLLAGPIVPAASLMKDGWAETSTVDPAGRNKGQIKLGVSAFLWLGCVLPLALLALWLVAAALGVPSCALALITLAAIAAAAASAAGFLARTRRDNHGWKVASVGGGLCAATPLLMCGLWLLGTIGSGLLGGLAVAYTLVFLGAACVALHFGVVGAAPDVAVMGAIAGVCFALPLGLFALWLFGSMDSVSGAALCGGVVMYTLVCCGGVVAAAKRTIPDL